MPLRKAAGFTLIEMLVSMAVLVLLVLFIAQLFSSATATATMSRKHIDADEAARLVFDRMGSDFASMVRRADVNYIFYKQANGGSTQPGNDAMYFYSEAPGYLNPSAAAGTSGSASTMALVGYRINQYNSYYSGIPVMERLGENLTWAGTPDTTGTFPGGMVFLTNPVSAASTLAGNWAYTLGLPPYNANVQGNQEDTSHYQVLSDMVFRMEFCFLLKSGTYALSGTSAVTGTTGYSNAPTAILPTTIPTAGIPTTTNYFTGGASPDIPGNVYGFPPDLAGIVVTIAVLDDASRKLIPSGNLPALAAALSDSLSGNTTPGNVQANPESTAQAWQAQLVQNGFAQSVHVPQTALAQVRVYERTFYLDAN
jgi:prepilin-type N-terminal cleavage/methylation domain-containing protein